MMTPEEAYAEGFCKVAEAAGIDPEQLCKTAGFLEMLSKYGKRYWELLEGSSKAYQPAANVFNRAKSYMKDALLGRNSFEGKSLFDLQNPERLRALYDSSVDSVRMLGDIITGRRKRKSVRGMIEDLGSQLAEARKVLATRLATGLGLAGTGYGAGYGLTKAFQGPETDNRPYYINQQRWM